MIRTYTLQAASLGFTLAKFGTADGTVVPATAATDKIIGVFHELDHGSGERASVYRGGHCRVVLGGTVTRGDWLTSNASSQAVTAAPAVGANVSTIGRAEYSGIAGDVIDHIVVIGSLQG